MKVDTRMLPIPETEEQVEGYLEEYRQFIASDGKGEVQSFVDREIEEETLFRLLGGCAIHLPAGILRWIGKQAGLWKIVALMAKLRINTPDWGFDSKHCNRNSAYNDLGLANLHLGHVSEAINCLDRAWRVYPCAHNTSFGLKTSLYHALKDNPDAQDVVDRYARFAVAFTRETDRMIFGDG